MGTTVRFNVDDEELERIDERAEEAGVTRAAYVRHRFRAGELLWRSGELDGEFLTEIAQKDDFNSPPSKETDTALSKTSQPASPSQELKQVILPEIPHKKSGDGISEDELKEVIFGTKDEREESISQAIEALYGDKVTRRADGLLVRTGEQDA